MTRLRKAETPQDLQKQWIGHSVCGRRPHVDGSGLDQLAYNLKIGPNGVIAATAESAADCTFWNSHRAALSVPCSQYGYTFTAFTAFYSFVNAV